MLAVAWGSFNLQGFQTRSTHETPASVSRASKPLPAQRAYATSHSSTPVRVVYYIVDSETSASALAKAMAKKSLAGGAHTDFVIVGKKDKAERVDGLAMAVTELTHSGIPVQLVDLR